MTDDTRWFDAMFLRNGEQAAQLAAEIQRLGLDTARVVVGRFGELFAQFNARADFDGSSDLGRANGPRITGPGVHLATDDAGDRRLQAEAERALESYLAVLRRLNDVTLPLFDRAWSRSASGGDERHSDRLEIPAVAPGGTASARIWVHNTTDDFLADLRLWTPGLFTEGDRRLTADAISFVPKTIGRTEVGASSEVLVVATVPAGSPPGLYHGQILIQGVPEAAFAVTVPVVAGRS